jgi:arginine decarboxylase
MLWRPVTLAARTAAAAEGGTLLNAFDNALIAAGIGNINLVKLSSIMPPAIRIIPLPRIKPGALVPTAYAAMLSDVPGETIAAAIGWGVPEDPEKAGVIMEVHDKITAKDAELMIEQMLDEAFQVRGCRMRERTILAVEHQVERAGCAVAAVTLLSPEDLLDTA